MPAQAIEQKFQAFKNSIKPVEFNSIEFLVARAEQIESQDPELAQRILVRVNNLKKAQEMAKTESQQKEQIKNKAVQISAIAEKKESSLEEKRAFPFHLEPFNFISNNAFISLVVIPSLIFAFYQTLWATERFESQAQVIVQQPDGMATMDASMAILSGLGVSGTGVSDTELVKAYILSNDMLLYLDKTLNLREHYSQPYIDLFSRMSPDDSWEEFLEYYHAHLDIYIDTNSSVVHIRSQAFDSTFAHSLTQTIVERAEWYINSIGHQLAEAQLEFIKREDKNVEQQLEQAKTRLLNFQQQYNLLDPSAEGMAIQQITYTIEGQISAKEAELEGLLAVMSPKAPQVVSTKNELRALKAQLVKERSKLSDDNEQSIPVSEILASFTELKVKMELALQAYTSSQISLEKSRIEAYRQLKFLIVVESATTPQESKYPDVIYNITLFTVLASMFFAIGRIVLATVRELK